jgi:transcriptional regulator with XRE-family HTH domain
MTDTSLGFWLRRERERRGISLRSIADQTKVAAPLLEGLENDDLSRWPGGIYRRAFAKAYANALGLNADEVVQRLEREHPVEEPVELAGAAPAQAAQPPGETAPAVLPAAAANIRPASSLRARVQGSAADLTVALILGLGAAAAESRLLWPVLLIAIYYAVGIVLTGTSPMVALLGDAAPAPPPQPADNSPRVAAPRPVVERRHQPRRAGSRAARPAASRAARARVQ